VPIGDSNSRAFLASSATLTDGGAKNDRGSLERCRLVEFPKISDSSAGSLTFIETARHVPFEIRRVFYVYDLASGGKRSAHAHKTLHEVIICLSGGLDVHLDNTYHQHSVRLHRPWLGLYVPPLIWISVGNFDPGTVYMGLVNEFYDESDYYRDYTEYLQAVRANAR
jgi:oxalate decarboxylase/phosphoglucose isomerase-like protein (cupin superfamily)